MESNHHLCRYVVDKIARGRVSVAEECDYCDCVVESMRRIHAKYAAVASRNDALRERLVACEAEKTQLQERLKAVERELELAPVKWKDSYAGDL